MLIMYKGKDGGKESPVTGYWLIEIKPLFSIVLLRFSPGVREQYHTHAFNAVTWFLKGELYEQRKFLNEGLEDTYIKYRRSLLPKLTRRNNLHRVCSVGVSWCLSFRGPWCATWQEFDDIKNKITTLTHGRKEL